MVNYSHQSRAKSVNIPTNCLFLWNLRLYYQFSPKLTYLKRKRKFSYYFQVIRSEHEPTNNTLEFRLVSYKISMIKLSIHLLIALRRYTSFYSNSTFGTTSIVSWDDEILESYFSPFVDKRCFSSDCGYLWVSSSIFLV